MSLFNFGKKVTATCACGGQCEISDIENARIIVLGACCQKSRQSFENVKLAAKELGLTDEVLNIGDVAQIATYGVMQTPALVVDSRVLTTGKLITVEDAKRLLAQMKN